MINDLQFIPTFSLQPNKCIYYNTVFKKSSYTNEYKHISKFRESKRLIDDTGKKINRLIRKSHNFEISDNAYRTLQSKINWLYYLAKSKSVVTPKGQTISNMKIAFITLTLPSKQVHPTSFITSNLLNQFLTEIRERFKMENYVWRLEFQKNGNVHYHIVTDCYVNFYTLRQIWNRILSNYGYLQAYTKKMNSLSLLDYHKMYNFNGKVSFDVNKERYIKGKIENWSNPPSVDVKSVISDKSISNYISKYFSKDSDNNSIKNDLDTVENSKNMRLWFCSRSLSKLGKISEFIDAYKYDIFAIISTDSKIKKFISKYATIFYFEIKNLIGIARKQIDYILKKYAFDNKYLPWGVDYCYT